MAGDHGLVPIEQCGHLVEAQPEALPLQADIQTDCAVGGLVEDNLPTGIIFALGHASTSSGHVQGNLPHGSTEPVGSQRPPEVENRSTPAIITEERTLVDEKRPRHPGPTASIRASGSRWVESGRRQCNHFSCLWARVPRRSDDDPARIERYQTEALIHGHLPVAGLAGFACHGPESERVLETEIETALGGLAGVEILVYEPLAAIPTRPRSGSAGMATEA